MLDGVGEELPALRVPQLGEQVVIDHRDDDDVGEDRRAHRGPREEGPEPRVRRKPGQRQGERDENVGEDGEEAEIADRRLDERRARLGDGQVVLQENGEPGQGGRANAVIFLHSPSPIVESSHAVRPPGSSWFFAFPAGKGETEVAVNHSVSFAPRCAASRSLTDRNA